MPKRGEFGRLVIKGETDDVSMNSSCDIDEHQYTDGREKDDPDSHINFSRRIAVKCKGSSVKCSLDRYIKMPSGAREVIEIESSAKIHQSTAEREGGHSLKLGLDKDGHFTLLLDGEPVMAKSIEFEVDSNCAVKVDIKGLYLKKMDVDIDGLEDD